MVLFPFLQLLLLNQWPETCREQEMWSLSFFSIFTSQVRIWGVGDIEVMERDNRALLWLSLDYTGY